MSRREVISPPFSSEILREKWLKTRLSYFPESPHLDDFQIVWSGRRQIRTLGSCSPYRRKISIAGELNHHSCLPQLEPLLYHEMCHAYLAPFNCRKHGIEFHKLERRHPQIKALRRWIKIGGWAAAVKRAHRI